MNFSFRRHHLKSCVDFIFIFLTPNYNYPINKKESYDMLNKTITFFEALTLGNINIVENLIDEDCKYFNWIQTYHNKKNVVNAFQHMISSAKTVYVKFDTIHNFNDIVFTEIKLTLDKRVVNLCFVLNFQNNKIVKINGYKR